MFFSFSHNHIGMMIHTRQIPDSTRKMKRETNGFSSK